MGLFITFEGPDGSGKSTVINKVFSQLKTDYPNKKIILTREPGDVNDKLTIDIRNLLLNKLDYNIDYRCEALLFAADRAQHISKFVKPNLDADAIIVCDRFVDSNIVYQGYGRKLGANKIRKISKFAANGIFPDKTFILMVTPEVGMQRIAKNTARELNRMDKEKMELHQMVYTAYKKIIKHDKSIFNTKKRIIEIDASKTENEVFNDVYKRIKKIIK
ncbi:MAG: dTMP kinase [Mycoplasmoidaceae bacterium]|nr:MAG: dTMP kinase [Mycoplasmoidaceae bacterium]